MRKATLSSFLAAFAGVSGFTQQALAGGEVNVYSYRQPELLKPALDLFTRQTGITANILFLDKGLIERIKAESENSPADVIIAPDINRLDELKQAGVTQAVSDKRLAAGIPAKFRDPDSHWFGLSADYRVIYAAKDRVKARKLSYEDLADTTWKGKVCMRDGRHSSNLNMFADIIAARGADFTEKWMLGVKANLAARPSGSDSSQVEAIAAGKCDLALGNATIIAGMLGGSGEEKKAAATVRVIYPADGGYANISGMAMAKNAPDRRNALALMWFLASRDAQSLYARETLEYPVASRAKPARVMKALGKPRPDKVPLADVIGNRDQASTLVDKTGINDGPGE